MSTPAAPSSELREAMGEEHYDSLLPGKPKAAATFYGVSVDQMSVDDAKVMAACLARMPIYIPLDYESLNP